MSARYFLIQTGAILLERTPVARKLGLGRGKSGRFFVALTTLGPLPLLFPPVFRDDVIRPFLHQIGAISNLQLPTLDLPLMIRFAGILHFGLLLAGALLPLVLDWKTELRQVSAMTRHIIWTHGSFIVLMIVGFALISLLAAPELASGAMLARIVCGFIAVFFDARPHLTNLLLKAGYHGLTIVFAIFVLVYSLAAVLPRARLAN